jgi:transcriptional regulator with XRE-family HTH domain
MEIREQLRKIREFRGLTIGGLSRKSGVSKTTISQWEMGKHKPRFEQLKKVLDALNITYEQLWQDFDVVFVKEALQKYRTTSREIELVLKADPDLTPAEIDVIMRIVLSKEREVER